MPKIALWILISSLVLQASLAPSFAYAQENEDGPKIAICHIPQGNLENMQTIEVDEHSVTLEAHVKHGDSIGPCVISPPPPPPPTNLPPVITLLGENPAEVSLGGTYNDAGATVLDSEDGDVTFKLITSGSVDTGTLGTYTISYNATDTQNLSAETKTRTVNVVSSGSGGDGGSGGDNGDGGGSGDGNGEGGGGSGDGGGSTGGGDSNGDGGSSGGNDGGGGSIPPQCADGSDNDGDTFADYPNDPGCENSQDNDESNTAALPPGENNTGGGGSSAQNSPGSLGGQSGGGSNSGSSYSEGSTSPVPPANGGTGQGTVAGVATTSESSSGEVLGESSCFYLRDYLRLGMDNDPAEVMKLQTFLHDFEGFSDLPVTGFFGAKTDEAVRDFQDRYKDDVLSPWDLPENTGYVYYTTRKKINEIYCQSVFPLEQDQLSEISAFRELMSALNVAKQLQVVSGKLPQEQKNKENGDILKDMTIERVFGTTSAVGTLSDNADNTIAQEVAGMLKESPGQVVAGAGNKRSLAATVEGSSARGTLSWRMVSSGSIFLFFALLLIGMLVRHFFVLRRESLANSFFPPASA